MVTIPVWNHDTISNDLNTGNCHQPQWQEPYFEAASAMTDEPKLEDAQMYQNIQQPDVTQQVETDEFTAETHQSNNQAKEQLTTSVCIFACSSIYLMSPGGHS